MPGKCYEDNITPWVKEREGEPGEAEENMLDTVRDMRTVLDVLRKQLEVERGERECDSGANEPMDPVGCFGNYLREQREASDISLRALCRELDMSPAWLSQVERGEKPPLQEQWWYGVADAVPGVELSTLRRLSRLDLEARCEPSVESMTLRLMEEVGAASARGTLDRHKIRLIRAILEDS